MTIPIAEDFAGIAAAQRALAEIDVDDECEKCSGGGWEMYGLGHGDPHFRVCTKCYNPEELPCP